MYLTVVAVANGHAGMSPWSVAHRNKEKGEEKMHIFFQFVLLVVGFILLVKGADFFVEGASGIAGKFGIPQLVIGLTIVAMGTSAPEAAVSITAALSGGEGVDLTIGNVVGSNIMNILVILGITAVIVPVAIQKSTLLIELPFMIGVTILLLLLGMTGNEITRLEGVILWAFFLVYMAYLLWMAKKGKAEAEEEHVEKKIGTLLFLTVLGAVAIVFGSDLVVDSASEIAGFFGVSQRVIGLTIVAFGTSLPELVTSVTAAKRGKADIAIGNIVGSNVFNILFVVGTTALITPVAYASSFLVDGLLAIVAGIILLLGVLRKQRLCRSVGIIMLAVYVEYFVYLMIS